MNKKTVAVVMFVGIIATVVAFVPDVKEYLTEIITSGLVFFGIQAAQGSPTQL
jgi:hypothetical protein